MKDRGKQIIALSRRDAPCRHLSRAGRFSEIDLAPDEVAAWANNRARIFASRGENFAPGRETRLRFDFAMPRRILEEALGRLDDAIADLRMGK